MITRRAWLRRYSINNTMLILLQRPDATDVRPIKEWNKAGRRVRKGERGIRILAPCRYRARDDDGNPVTDDDGAPLYRVRTFKVVSVFDVSQTDGDPLPEPETGLVPAELRGAAPEHLWSGIADQISEQGYTVERGDCGSAYGFTDFPDRCVRVRDAVDDAQAAKTLIHELAHILCGHEERITTVPRTVLEVEAESVACIVAAVAGLDSLPYSVPYVAGWADDVDTARQSAERVAAVADAIITRLQASAPTAPVGAP
ncbi:ArdC-like ssDNA-binding domain-containing protein [Nocardiopsis composta]|uniref:Antirestriction protein ArdC n=1 Tax=Nocardiopsis composta TaxID=157465 RepID=A0A7W8QG82_9ACTN|nr:antirestriction protein ArdC [Nocardiopsis composta]